MATTAAACGIPKGTIKMLGHWQSAAYMLYIQTPSPIPRCWRGKKKWLVSNVCACTLILFSQNSGKLYIISSQPCDVNVLWRNFLSMDAHFDGAIKHTLCCVGCLNLPEQRQSVREACLRGEGCFRMVAYLIRQVLCYEMLPFYLDVKRGTDDSAVICSQIVYTTWHKTAYVSTERYIDCCMIRSYNTRYKRTSSTYSPM